MVLLGSLYHHRNALALKIFKIGAQLFYFFNICVHPYFKKSCKYFLRFVLTFFNIVKSYKTRYLGLKMLSNSPDVLAGRRLTQSAKCDVTHRLAMTVFTFCASASFHNDQITFATLIISGSNGMAWNEKYRKLLGLITFQSWGLTRADAWPPQIPWVQTPCSRSFIYTCISNLPRFNLIILK